MLDLARRYQASIAAKIGYCNVRFAKGRIQDLALDLELADAWLHDHPIGTVQDLANFETVCDELRVSKPMVSTGSVDVVVSNCVLNLVKPADKEKLFSEIFRVLKRGGRAVISDIVSDEDPTSTIRNDPDLWSGCIAGAFREDAFLAMFEAAGFYGIEILSRTTEPWRTIDGIEFRSVTVRAYKGKEGSCLERQQAVVYRGPWRSVTDDDGHVLHRGRRMAVCDKTFNILNDPGGPYHTDVEPVPPRIEIPLDRAEPFACQGATFRGPRQTKGQDYRQTTEPDLVACCEGDACC
jgi:SAM-dependent methyltransferase